MATVNVELIRGTRIKRKWLGQNEFTDVIIVSDLANPSGSTFEALEAAATTAAGLTLGMEHPTQTFSGSPAYLKQIESTLISTTKVKIFATYQGYPWTQFRFEVFGTTNNVRTTTDKNGNALTLTKPAAMTDVTEPATYTVPLQILTPQTVVRMTVVGFAGPSQESAVSDSIKYTGYTNANTFLGAPAGRWLCTRYSIIDSGPGEGYFSWTRIVEIQFNKGGWAQTLSYEYSDGRVFATQDQFSQKKFELYGETTFSSNWLE